MRHLIRHYGRRLVRSVHRRGIGGTLQVIAHDARQMLAEPHIDTADADIHPGVETAVKVDLADLNVQDANFPFGSNYTPTPFSKFHELMQSLPLGSYQDYTFIDFGAGKGRTLLLALEYGFRRIVGVEFASELCEVARKNVEAYIAAEQAPNRIEIECLDAAEYRIPEGPCVFYFFNPFNERVMEKVLVNIAGSLNAMPRPAVLIYLNPVHKELVEELTPFRRFSETSLSVTYSFGR
jgi:SAM-dependent methyltransferase